MAGHLVLHHVLSASILPVDLIYFVISFITIILCCRFISSSVESSCMLCRRCRLYSLNKAKIPAQLCSPYFRVMYLLLPRALLHSNGGPSASVCLTFAVLDLVLVQNFLLHHLLPTLIHLLLVQHFLCLHCFCVFLQKSVRLVFHLFSRPSFPLSSFFCTRHFFVLRHAFMHHQLMCLFA